MLVITDESIGVFQLLGARARAAPPKVYAYADNETFLKQIVENRELTAMGPEPQGIASVSNRQLQGR